MTDLESPKKNNDCYFYYYSTCSKGDSCGFRHEPSALGCETMCSFWKEGKCLNIHCNFRHMELRKNRKVIPCYWESQPGGCLKPHCPFMHQNARPLDGNEDQLNKPEGSLPENCTQAGNFKSTSSVDSLVVNFEEESDSESTPSASPVKLSCPMEKTLEEIKLEKIAAACAAYYAYPGDTTGDNHQQQVIPSVDDLRHKILQRVKSAAPQRPPSRKLSAGELAHILGDSSLNASRADCPPIKRRKKETREIKIKTLDEIRAERDARRRIIVVEDIEAKTRMQSPDRRTVEEAEVSSTSNDEPGPTAKPSVERSPPKPLRKLNLRKIKTSLKESKTNNSAKSEDPNSNLIEDETLLLLDDTEEDIQVSVKSEDDLLNEIDNLLGD